MSLGHRERTVMPLWIPLTFAAAFAQNVRSLLQKQLTGELSTAGATYCRFIYALPFTTCYAVFMTRDLAPIGMSPAFFLYCVVGGTAQILATLSLIAAFSYRNFAVATGYSKTETVQAALFGIIVLGDAVSITAALAIAVSLIGVLVMSAQDPSAIEPRPRLRQAFISPAALLGICTGAGFAVAAVCWRAAALSLQQPSAAVAASITLATAVGFQTLSMGLYLVARDLDEFVRILKSWPRGLWVGAAGMAASAGWFTAMTLQNAAYVRAVGQVELFFSFAASTLIFGERSTRREILGVSLLILGVVGLLLGES
jgi:drug/metabolite transporter (DMT)-like permease